MSHEDTPDWYVLTAIILALFAVFAVIATGFTRNYELNQEQQDTLTVSGNANVFVDPNRAEVFIRVETRDQAAKQAQAKNRTKSDTVMNVLNNAGVSENDLEHTQYRLQRLNEYNRETRKNEFKGYQHVNVMKLTTEDLDQVGAYIDAAVEAGANGIDAVVFGLTRERKDEVRSNALDQASQEAKSKADTLANSLGVHLDRPVRISEANFHYQPHRATMEMAEAKQRGDGGTPGTQVSPEKVNVRASLNVDYRIN